MKNCYRIFIFIISIVIGLSFAVWRMNNPSVKVSFNNPITEDDYVYLKECTLKVAKNTLTEFEDPNVRGYRYFDDKNLYVTCELIENDIVKCKVYAEYPIIFDENILIDKDNIQITGKINFDGVTYQEEEIIKPLLSQLMGIFLVSFIIIGLINVIFYYAPKELKRSFAWQKEL